MGLLFMSEMRHKIEALYGPSFLRKSAMNIRGGAGVFEKVLKGRNYGEVLEIGTYRGVSAAEMSQYCKHVTTIDLAHGKLEQNGTPFDRCAFWGSVDVHNCSFHAVADDAEKAQFIGGREFDFAFIDGGHHGNSCARDFELVKRCGRVLFHDYDDSGQPHLNAVYDFVNSLPRSEVTVMDIFALWIAPWQSNG